MDIPSSSSHNSVECLSSDELAILEDFQAELLSKDPIILEKFQTGFLQITEEWNERAKVPFLAHYPIFLTSLDSVDKGGYSLAHRAVMVPINRCLLKFILCYPGVNLTARNHNGETAALLLEDYHYNKYSFVDHNVVDKIPQLIAEGNTSEALELLRSIGSFTIRYRQGGQYTGETVLHLALRHQRFEVARQIIELTYSRALADFNSKKSGMRLFAIHNSQGQTPLDVALCQQAQGVAGAEAMVNLLQAQPRRIESLLPVIIANPVINTVLLKEQLSKLSRFLGTFPAALQSEHFNQCRSFLPTVCSLSAFICQLALERLKLGLASYSARALLSSLFGTYGNQTITRQLEQLITVSADYLNTLVQVGQVNNCLRLQDESSDADEYSHLGGWLQSHDNKVYINLRRYSSNAGLLILTQVVIHEHLHKLCKSFDFSGKTSASLERGYFFFELVDYYALAVRGEWGQSVRYSDRFLFACQERLEKGEILGNLRPIGSPWFALRDAEAVTLAILGLAADFLGCMHMKAGNVMAIREQMFSADYLCQLVEWFEQKEQLVPPALPRCKPLSLQCSTVACSAEPVTAQASCSTGEPDSLHSDADAPQSDALSRLCQDMAASLSSMTTASPAVSRSNSNPELTQLNPSPLTQHRPE